MCVEKLLWTHDEIPLPRSLIINYDINFHTKFQLFILLYYRHCSFLTDECPLAILIIVAVVPFSALVLRITNQLNMLLSSRRRARRPGSEVEM